MANSYENTIMPEKPELQIKPDAIPVDDKGQPLPDPTESLGTYIAPKGVEELKKTYSEVEVDETVRETMEPPQRTGLLRKHRSGTKRGYDYYGTPAGSIPNDSNGLKPSPLSELFSEAEALEPDFDLDKIKNHVLSQEPAPGSEYKVVETPKLDPSLVKQGNTFDSSDKILSDSTLKRTEVVKDPNAPKFLDMYKESTNTKVIYQSGQDPSENQKSKTENDAKEIFAEHSRVTKTKKRLSKREEKKAIKAAIKLEKKKAKERRKAEKAARKAAKKGKKTGAETAPQITEPDEIMKMQAEAARRENEEKLIAQEKAAAQKVEEEKLQAEKEADIQKIKAAQEEKEEAEKQLELANRQKEEAQQEVQRAAKEAEKRIQEEKEAAELQKEQVIRQLNEEKEAVRKAEEEAENARAEAEQLKAELEKMKEAAAQALAQKQEAEDAARLAREEKENLGEELKKLEKENQTARSEATSKKAAAEKAKPEKAKTASKAKSEKESDTQKPKQTPAKTEKKENYTNSPTMEVIKRRLAEMEAQLSSKDSDE